MFKFYADGIELYKLFDYIDEYSKDKDVYIFSVIAYVYKLEKGKFVEVK